MTSGYILLFVIWCSVLLDSHSSPLETSLGTVLDSIFFFDLSLGVTNKEHRFKDINNFCVSHAIGIRRRGHESDGDMNKPQCA